MEPIIIEGVTDAPKGTKAMTFPQFGEDATFVPLGDNKFKRWSGKYGEINAAPLTSGDLEFPDAPEFTSVRPDTGGRVPTLSEALRPMPMGDALQRSAAYSFGVTPKQQAQIIDQIPGATLTRDAKGNRMVKYKGEKYYINKPGVSEADAVQFVSLMAQFAPIGKLTQIFTKSAPGLVKFLGYGAAGGASSALTDVGAQVMGADQDISPGRAAFTAATTALAVPVSFFFQRLAQSPTISNNVRRVLGAIGRDTGYIGRDGKLSDAGKKMLSDVGIDPDGLERAAIAEALKIVRGGGDDAADFAAARSLEEEFGITFTPGQRVGASNPQVRKDELDILAGTEGPQAAAVMRGDTAPLPASVAGQNQSILRAMDDTAQTVAPDSGAVNLAAGTDDASQVFASGLRTRQAEAFRAEQTAWKEATSAIKETTILGDGLKQLPRFLALSIRGGQSRGAMNATDTPMAATLMKDIGKRNRRYMRPDGNIGNAKVEMQQVENLRRRVNARIGDAEPGSADYRALLDIKRGLDDWMTHVFDKGMIYGSKDALEALKSARGLSHDYRRQFISRPNDAASRVIQRMSFEDMTAEQVARSLIGQAQSGFSANAIGIVKHIQNNFPEEASKEILDQLRAAVFMRLHNRAISAVPDATGELFSLSGKVVSTNIKNALTKGDKFMQTLYGKADLAKIKRYGEMMRRVSYVPPKDALNPSGSGYTMLRKAWKNMRSAGGGGAAGWTAFSFGESITPGLGYAFVGGGATVGGAATNAINNQLSKLAVNRALNSTPLFKPVDVSIPLAATGRGATADMDQNDLPF
jgi:hypothetical protein